ncbi:NAD(+)/NADH kinase [Faecalibaculum rodentium]|uniref:NAD(+)/NADH kinase n=1 Tax=Faecalibaculum rodentium TaxID=1702221 RepID=UPI001F59E938|nr:NAD(+)/NADH kinase [Faecalibaculum rodentium]
MRFALVDRGDIHSQRLACELRKKLEAITWQEDAEYPERIFCIGGDGTMLRAIHEYIDQLDTVAFIGIHTGNLGFFTDFTADEMDEMLKLLAGDAKFEECRLVEAVFPEKDLVLRALNEIRLESITKTLTLDISIDGEFFERSNGSGICVSTQPGSTGINRSLNGAIVDDGLSILQLTEIMPIAHHNHHTLRNPYVMKGSRTIELKTKPMHDVVCSYDNLKYKPDGETGVIIRLSKQKVRFVRYRPYSYIRRLKNLY